jgi:Zn-dependent peptidase ImmA (M78 family)
MKQLSTIAKGDFFEEQVFNLVKHLLDTDDFFVNGKKSKIFWKKSYYGRNRENEIVCDVSIETYLNDSEKYSLLTIIECKNYKGTIPVGVVHNLESKLREFGEHNTKGIIFSKTGFEQGVITSARNLGIGLAKVNSKDKIEWVNYRKDRDNNRYSVTQADHALSSNNYGGVFFSYFNNKSFESLPDLLINLGVIDKYIPNQSDIFIPWKTSNELERIVGQLKTENLYESSRLNHENLCKFLSEAYNVKFVFDKSLDIKDKNKILGKITFEPLVIYITEELLSDINRWRFTLAHEVGHLILHAHILKEYFDDNIDVEKSMSLDGGVLDGINNRMEVQANMFASRLLIPIEPLTKDVQRFFIKENIRSGYLFLDSQSDNIARVNNFLSELKHKYQVSNEAAKYRLKELDFLRDENSYSQLESVKKIINKSS